MSALGLGSFSLYLYYKNLIKISKCTGTIRKKKIITFPLVTMITKINHILYYPSRNNGGWGLLIEIWFLTRLFEEFESYSTHPGAGVRVTPWLRFCLQVHHNSVTTRCIALTFSTMLPNNNSQYSILHFMQVMALFYLEILV